MVDDAIRYAAVAVGALLGANLRFVVGNWASDRWGTEFPFGTLIVNVSGAVTIGFFLSLIADRIGLNPLWRLFFVTGFLGGYTTFSSYTWEALTLVNGGNLVYALAYVVGTNGAGLLGVWVGAQATRVLR